MLSAAEKAGTLALEAIKTACKATVAVLSTAVGLAVDAMEALEKGLCAVVDLGASIATAIQLKELLIDTQLSLARQMLHFKLKMVILG